MVMILGAMKASSSGNIGYTHAAANQNTVTLRNAVICDCFIPATVLLVLMVALSNGRSVIVRCREWVS